MPIRHGGIAASRASTWPRDHFWRTTIAPGRSRPTTWNEFLPISMPIVATVAVDLLDMAMLHLTIAPSPASLAGGAGARPDHSISGPRRVGWRRNTCVDGGPQRTASDALALCF